MLISHNMMSEFDMLLDTLNDAARVIQKRISKIHSTTAQLHSAKSEHRLCTGSNLAYGVTEIRDVENL